MVFEKLYNAAYLKEHKHITLILGVAYAVCGISFSLFLFPNDPAPMAIAFISLFSVTSLGELLFFREPVQFKGISVIQFIKEHKHLFSVFANLFIGILLTFAFFSIFMPSLSSNQLFGDQADLVYTLSAKKIFQVGDFSSILLNNSKVLLVCLLSSLLFGISTIFLLILVWNASVIGVVFGLAAKHSALAINQNPLFYFLLILLAALPHITLEISAYLFGGIVGDKISSLFRKRKIMSKTNKHIVNSALIILIIAFIVLIVSALVEVIITPKLIEILL